MRNRWLALTAILTIATASANAADLPQPIVSAPPPDPAMSAEFIVNARKELRDLFLSNGGGQVNIPGGEAGERL